MGMLPASVTTGVPLTWTAVTTMSTCVQVRLLGGEGSGKHSGLGHVHAQSA